MDLKKIKKILSLLFILIWVFLLLGLWIHPILYFVAIVPTVLYFIVYWKNWRCPYCGKMLSRGISTRCLNCGEDVGISIKF